MNEFKSPYLLALARPSSPLSQIREESAHIVLCLKSSVSMRQSKVSMIFERKKKKKVSQVDGWMKGWMDGLECWFIKLTCQLII